MKPVISTHASIAGRTRANAMGAASLLALGVAMFSGPAAMAQDAAAQDASQISSDKAVNSQTAPSTNVPSSNSPAATQTPGVSTDASASGDVGPNAAASDEVVVTGFRASIQNAVAEKRRADQILESVSSEDIGKLPDNSIAESIARLPGLTAQRVNGRDQVISIRGFSPDFSTTLLNGREQVTTGDNRAVEFDQYPSELLGQVVVYKTPAAGLIGQGLSGTIDLRSIRPLEYGKDVLALSARGEYVDKGKLNADSKDKGYRLSGTFVHRFADDTLGVTLGVARSDSPSQFERYNAWGYPTFDGNNATYGTLQTDGTYKVRPEYAAAQGKFLLGGAKPYVQSNRLTRTAALGTVEWQPTSNFTNTLDVLYTRFKEKQNLRGIELPLWWGGGGEVLEPNYTVKGDTITSGTWDHVKGVVRNDYIERDARIFSAGWNSKYVDGPWTLVGDLSYSRVKRQETYIEDYSGVSRGVANGPFDTLGFETEGNGITTFNSKIDYADPNLIKLTSPRGWADGTVPGSVPGGQDGYYSNDAIKDRLYALRGSVARDLGGGFVAEIGGNYTSRKKSYTPTEYLLSATANVNDPTHSTSVVVPSQYYLGTSSLAYLGIPGMISFDTPNLIADGIVSKINILASKTQLDTWKLDEKVGTGWFRVNFDRPLLGGSFTGNAGVQAVRTDQGSTGYRILTGSADGVFTDDGRKYWELLPSFNGSMRFSDQDVLRLGLGRTLARARMDQMKASFSYTTNASNITVTDPYRSYFSGAGGNPRLKPWIADGADLSYEHYFSRSAYIAVAGYYKHLESYIYDQLSLHDFTGTPTGTAQTPATFIGVITQPVNGKGGELYGGEISGSLQFSAFASWLDGFGALGSYSYTHSNITANPGTPTQPLPGLSKSVANGTVFFEKDGFSARTSVRYRSKFLAQVIALGPVPDMRNARSETIVDAQIGYEFKKGPLKGLGILVQGQNLTSEPFVTEDSASHLIIDSQDYGRRFLAGISYKF